MNVYNCYFIGRHINSSGVFHSIHVNIRCTPDRILGTLYKQYEHIRCLMVFTEDDELAVNGETIGGVVQTWGTNS